MRISRDQMLIEIAHVVAKRSTCLRAQVGAVIAQDGRIVSTGYAGAPAGLPHCTPELCDLSHPCTRTVHAEAGAISYAARAGIRLYGATLYCTLMPCEPCAKLIINAGIQRVVYDKAYRKTEGIELLKQARIDIAQLSATRPELPNLHALGVGSDTLHVGVRSRDCEGNGCC